jgi:hypothetical protein
MSVTAKSNFNNSNADYVFSNDSRQEAVFDEGKPSRQVTA